MQTKMELSQIEQYGILILLLMLFIYSFVFRVPILNSNDLKGSPEDVTVATKHVAFLSPSRILSKIIHTFLIKILSYKRGKIKKRQSKVQNQIIFLRLGAETNILTNKYFTLESDVVLYITLVLIQF